MTVVSDLGFGVGFRPKHSRALLGAEPVPSDPSGQVDWLEVITENFLGVGGRPRRLLSELGERYPLTLHGVGLSIAGTDPLDQAYLLALRELAGQTRARLVSDHLCWTSLGGRNSHDLLPVAYTPETLTLVASRVDAVQERLGRRLYLENPSAYVAFRGSEMGEADFLAELCARSGCGLLLDVNNLYVNACNLGEDIGDYLGRLERLERAAPGTIGYFHLAGHAVLPDIRIDTHDDVVPEAVWTVYQDAVRRFPRVPTLLEWDGKLPELAELRRELAKARSAHAAAVAIVSSPESATASIDVGRQVDTQGPAWSVVQEVFFEAITSGEPSRKLQPLLSPQLPAKAAVGAGVYTDAYHLRIVESARDSMPALHNVLGPTAFARLIRDYLERHPSRHVSIKYATAELPAYLATCSPPIAVGVPNRVLADLAALEQAVETVFDAKDSPAPVSVGLLEEIAPEAWEHVGFDFLAALVVAQVDYDVAAVVDAVAEGRVPDRPRQSAAAYAVFRTGEDVERRALTADEGRALALLASGQSFRATVELLGEQDEDGLVERLVGSLVTWISWGLVHGIRVIA